MTFHVPIPSGARLTLRVTPGTRTDAIEGPQTRADGTTVLKLRVSAPPDKGKANTAVLALLAKTTRLPKSAFTLQSGETSRTKRVDLACAPDALLAALAVLAAR